MKTLKAETYSTNRDTHIIKGISELLTLTKIIVFLTFEYNMCLYIQILYDTFTSTLDSYRPQCKVNLNTTQSSQTVHEHLHTTPTHTETYIHVDRSKLAALYHVSMRHTNNMYPS